MIADQHQRLQATDVTTSCIVQAPAGSGKTELLIQRLLALLAVVDQPQQILAITFTNKAATEMRQRLLQALSYADTAAEPQQDHAALTWRLARQALHRHGENLLRNPARLAIQTIDSLCATLVRKMPWMTRFGGMPDIAEDATRLYEAAVKQLFLRLEQTGSVSEALKVLLQHLDNDVAVVQRMLIGLLGRRDQWLRHLAADKTQLLEELNQVLERICAEQIQCVRDSIPADLIDDLLWCVGVAAVNCPDDVNLQGCRHLTELPDTRMAALPQWLALVDLLLTGSGTLRKTVNKNNGFPSGDRNKPAKERMLKMLQSVDEVPGLTTLLAPLRTLPRQHYSMQQWLLLEALFDLLPQLVAELWLVFRGRGQTDFIEIALKANHSLGVADNPSDLLLKLDHQLQHILVDEFQDTSRLQYQLFNTLTAGWEPGDGRTLFLVGDPMQSIYRFREAEVGLFLRSFEGSFGSVALPLQPLRLRCNFRSQQGIVDWVNQAFAKIFPPRMDVTTGAVPLAIAEAVKPPLVGNAVVVHATAGLDDQLEARRVVDIIRQAQAEDPDQSIAVLVRGRNHLRRILPLLRQEGIGYQARDIDLLEARPAALDIVHLARALVHRGDRLAWTAVLRAPWCGLTLQDLHCICAPDAARTIPTVLSDPLVIMQLSMDGQQRLARVWPVLQRGLAARGQQPLRVLVEGCWLALGGPVGLSESAIADADLVFGLIEDLDQGGDLQDLELLQKRLQMLFAASDSRAGGQLQIMTIHKAKGLQFDTVILPGLGKTARKSDAPLLRWLEHPQYGLLLAPVNERGSQEKDPVYQLVARLDSQKEEYESARMLYVATTRAIRRLHLLGHARVGSNGDMQPVKGSLLEKLWPLVAPSFTRLSASPQGSETEEKPPLMQRLPDTWVMPEAQPVVVALPEHQTVAAITAGEDSVEQLYSGWEVSMHRHVGTLVHQFLERIARFGDSVWSHVPDEQRNQHIKQSLRGLGVRLIDVEEGCAKVVAAVEKTLLSSRGQWLLYPHPQHAAELPLTGYRMNQIVHMVIDRTFIDKEVRWVIDYKTSAPDGNEPLNDFLQREATRYHHQLLTYMELMQQFDPGFPVKGAFYFPLVDGWYEL